MESLLDSLIHFTCLYAHSAHWIIFVCFLLSGFSIPISEELLIVTGGVIASTCIPNETLFLFSWVYAGSIVAAWETYWMGRYFGPQLYRIKWFRRLITPKRILKLHHYYEKFGVFAFIVGRFFPGGIRIALFVTAGLGKMPFLKFVLRDGVGAAIFVSTFFSLGYYFGANHDIFMRYMTEYSHILMGLLAISLLTCALYLWWKSHKATIG